MFCFKIDVSKTHQLITNIKINTMKKTNQYGKAMLFLVGVFVAGIVSAATITVNPGNNLKSILQNAGNGDVIQITAGTYNINSMVTNANNLTVIGLPFENSNNDESKIDDVEIHFTDASNVDNWVTNGRTIIRGIKFTGGDHQIQLDNEGIVTYCIFVGGVDQLSFDKDGYGEVAYCQFYNAGDDGVDNDSEARASGAYINVHHNYFERSIEDGIEFRTHGRVNGSALLINEYHHNTFFKCGTDLGDGGGDAIQIIDQEINEDSREIFVYNNVIDGDGTTHNGISCNRNRNSNAQTNPNGAHDMREKLWIYNNTVVNTRSGGINGAPNAYIFNNIVQNSPEGYVRGTVKSNLTYQVNSNTSNVTDQGSNHYNTNPQLDADLAPITGSYSIDKGLSSYTGGGRTITPEFQGTAPDLGGIEFAGPVITYTLTTNAGPNGSVTPGGTYTEGTTVSVTATANAGYEFDYWSGDASGTNPTIDIVMDGDKSVTANFQVDIPEYFTLTITTSGAGTGTVTPASGNSYLEDTDVQLVATPDEGFVFAGWGGDASGSQNPLTITMDTDKSIIASFEEYVPITEVILDPTDDSFVLDNSTGTNKGSSALISIKNVTRKVGLVKFDLNSITDEVVSATLVLTGANAASGGNLSVYSTSDSWNEETVTYNNAPAQGNLLGATSLGAAGTTYSIDISSFVIAQSNGDKVVSLWLNDNQSNGSRYDFHSKEAVSNGPKLILEVEGGTPPVFYNLTTNASGGTVTPSSGSFEEGTQVSLTATPDGGYEFAGWSGDASGTANPITITMDSDKSVTASFTQLPLVDLTTDVVGNGTTDPFSRSYFEGVTATITAIPDAGWTFAGWSGDASGTENPLSLVMDADKHVIATFTENTGPITTTVTASDDAYVRNGDNRSKNYGSLAELQIKQTGTASAKRYSYLQFDLSNIGTVTSAKLRVKSVGNTDRDILVYSTGDGWDEGSITWSSKPALGNLEATYVIGANGNYTVDVTSYVAAQANGYNKVSFGLKGASSRLMTLSSKEGSYAPRLIIEHDGSPSTSINAVKSKVEMYPNPTTGLVTININNNEFTSGTVKVVNSYGAVIETTNISNTMHVLDMSSYSAGLYFITVISDNNIETTSTILKK